MASETGIQSDLFDVAGIFKSTPFIAALKPGGRYFAKDKDMYEAGGVYMLMKTLRFVTTGEPSADTLLRNPVAKHRVERKLRQKSR